LISSEAVLLMEHFTGQIEAEMNLEDLYSRITLELLVGLSVFVITVNFLPELLVFQTCMGDDAFLKELFDGFDDQEWPSWTLSTFFFICTSLFKHLGEQSFHFDGAKVFNFQRILTLHIAISQPFSATLQQFVLFIDTLDLPVIVAHLLEFMFLPLHLGLEAYVRCLSISTPVALHKLREEAILSI
jgi:hypothetical protein